MKIKEITEIIEAFAPLHYAADFDNVGLLVGSPETEITSAVMCLDVTEESLDRAIEQGDNLIITHHPVIFSPMKRLTDASRVERIVRKAIRHDIAIYAAHTNLDSTRGGVSWRMADKISLKNVRFLEQRADENCGYGVVGELEKPMNQEVFIQLIKEKFELTTIKSNIGIKKDIKTVALCGGSGGSQVDDAIRCKADVYVVGELRYNNFMDAPEQITLLEIGHYESEICAIDILFDVLTKKMITFALHKDFHTNPVRTF